jgi:RNA polymerase I-specific transcription initiation factor RRN7
LYLKSLQLILRHQIWFLIHEKGLPQELERVIFDLWALRIAQLGDRIASESQETDSQSQVFSTLDTDESGTDNERNAISTSKGRDKKLNGAPNLYDCLALCYLGTSTLRLPVTPGDLHAWTTDGKMPYRRAIRVVPLAMRDRLPPSYHAILDPSKLLRHRRFYTTLTNLEISYEKVHGVLWPPLNVPLLLFRYIKELALPLDLYDATLHLADLLGYNFALEYNGRRQLGLRHLPEAQLIGCFVVCVKLFYPFDKIRRLPKSSSEPAVSVVDWKAWCKQLSKAKRNQQKPNSDFTSEEFTQLQEDDVFQLLPKQLDQYLDFYNATFLDEAETQRTKYNDGFKNALYDMFPIENAGREPTTQPKEASTHEQKLETVRAVHGSMKTRAVVRDDQEEADVLRPGQSYPMWKKVEDVPGRAAVFYDEAARLAGFSMEMLVTAVFTTECRIEQWRRMQSEGKGKGAVETL